MSLILFDDQFRGHLLPLVFTRPVGGLRVGVLTIAEKWEKTFSEKASWLTAHYLQEKYPLISSSQNLLINGSVCPDERLFDAISALRERESLCSGDMLLALKINASDLSTFSPGSDTGLPKVEYPYPFVRIHYPEDIFRHNDEEIRKDFRLLTQGRSSATLSTSNTVLGDDIFVEEGVTAECATFNTLQGPIYLGKNSQVWEGSHIRGSFALGEQSIVKMGAKIYGKTSIGPHCKVGGEVNNSVIYGNSSKGHEGYLGNSVLGEWCNIGADSNNSNMKNTYADVKLWDYATGMFRSTGLQFCGMIMGDHSKCGINTMFNTGTVVGVGANIFGAGFPPKFVADFVWGGTESTEPYRLDKMFETAERVFERRSTAFDDTEKNILKAIYDLTCLYKTGEKELL